MSSVEFDRPRFWLTRLEDLETRDGSPLTVARARLARRLGVPLGTLENIKRGRSKGVRGWVESRLRDAVISALEAEVRTLSHEIDIARRTGLGPSEDQIREAETALEQARRLLGK